MLKLILLSPQLWVSWLIINKKCNTLSFIDETYFVQLLNWNEERLKKKQFLNIRSGQN